MALFNPNNMKIGKPVRKQFMDGDVYILPGLNSLQSIQLHRDLSALDSEAEDFSIRYAATVIRGRVVNGKGKPLFGVLTVDELANEYDAKLIDELYCLVTDVTGDPFTVSDAEKNS